MIVDETLCGYLAELRPDLADRPEAFRELPLRRLISSVEMLDLLCFLEERFAITISDDEVTPEHFADIESIVHFIKAKGGDIPQGIV